MNRLGSGQNWNTDTLPAASLKLSDTIPRLFTDRCRDIGDCLFQGRCQYRSLSRNQGRNGAGKDQSGTPLCNSRDKGCRLRECESYGYPFAAEDIFDIIERAFITADMQKIIALGDETEQIIFLEQLCAFSWRDIPFSLGIAEYPALHIRNADLFLTQNEHFL